MLTFSGLALRRGTQELFNQANLSVHNGQKVGITGANGAGKSSLFALILNELGADEGELTMPPGWVIAHVRQETPSADESIIEYALQGDHEYIELKRAMDAADDQQLARLLAKFEAIDGYTAESRAARLLHGLGFKQADLERAVKTFSGGWRMRLNLAQALMCRSDLLLLDEPTNHLDLETVVWLQDWLLNYQGTLLVISHDREFLDSITSHIVHIEQGGLKLYKGNYTAFELIRAEQLAQQQIQYDKQQREAAHIQSFVDRFRAKATKAKQAQSRIKALQKMQSLAPVISQSEFSFSFKQPDKIPDRLFHIDEGKLGYGDTTILDNIQLQVLPGDRIGLVGANGAGKSTLIKLIADELDLQAGEIWKAQTLKVGYFAQHQLDQLVGEHSPLQHMRELDNKTREQELRNYLGGFGFAGERVDAKVSIFSGGEKSRLVLAMLVYQNPNLLLLDEPTNHLDMEMRQALALALQDYAGALIVVSHDRFLIKTVTDSLLLVDEGKVEPFEGDIEDYSKWSFKRLNQTSKGEDCVSERGESSEVKQESSASRKELRKQQAELRKQLQPLKRTMQDSEKKLDQLNNKKQKLEEKLSDASIYEDANKDQLTQLFMDKKALEADIEDAEMVWLDASEIYEEAYKAATKN